MTIDDPIRSRASAEQRKWRELPRTRPTHIETPGPGQESVWSYPRPPRVEPVSRMIRVEFAGALLAESAAGLRVIETSSPPVYYVPPGDVALDLLQGSEATTFCEWKGTARYWNLRVADRCATDAAWSYADPEPGFESIRDHLAFHAGRVDSCTLGGERVIPQSGQYYGGWITSEIVGPFKGEPGSERW